MAIKTPTADKKYANKLKRNDKSTKVRLASEFKKSAEKGKRSVKKGK